MRLAISNIAWDITEDNAVASLLERFAIDAIDVAPGKYFPDPHLATNKDIDRVKAGWQAHGIEITGMQALLFGTTGLNVFGPPESQAAMLQHLRSVCRIASGLGATRLVFGSPGNRDRTGLNDEQAVEVALPFFRQWGGVAQDYGVLICLEPNPACYGANFMTTSVETALIVQQVAHGSIKMQFDTGALTINHEEPEATLRDYASLIGHVHASEPDLLPLGEGGTDHHGMMAALRNYLPDQVVSIEMRATCDGRHMDAVERALKVATLYYRDQDLEVWQ